MSKCDAYVASYAVLAILVLLGGGFLLPFSDWPMWYGVLGTAAGLPVAWYVWMRTAPPGAMPKCRLCPPACE